VDWKKRLKALGIVRERRAKKKKGLRKVKSGREGEDAASLLLEENSLRILERNVRYRDGEIDIIADDHGTTVFVEVKRRKDAAKGTPAEAVTPRKRERVIRAARRWLAAHPRQAGSVRFDVVAIDNFPGKPPVVRLHKDAFSPQM